jgi:hypothetical protein
LEPAGAILQTAPFVLLCALLAACSGPPQAAPANASPLSVHKSLGGRQCEPDSGRTLAALQAELQAAGVRVQRAACGDDGRLRPAVCGAGDGRIGILTIAAAQRTQAERLGYAPLAQLPDAREMPCR